jgi:hypothetical protein
VGRRSQWRDDKSAGFVGKHVLIPRKTSEQLPEHGRGRNVSSFEQLGLSEYPQPVFMQFLFGLTTRAEPQFPSVPSHLSRASHQDYCVVKIRDILS